MMKVLAIVVLIELCTIVYAVDHGVTVSCMMAYEEGGAPAVFNSLECPQWGFSAESTNSTKNCEFATLQGHRQYQEDRVTCNLDLKLPFSGEGPSKEITVGIAAVFDGHGGDEASEMASKKLINYFLLHVVFTTYKQVLSGNEENSKLHAVESSQRVPEVIDDNSLLLVLEEALLKTIEDIDSEFSEEALHKGYVSGSTGIIVLLFKGQFLVVNIGDSKALLCSQKVISNHDTEGAFLKEAHAEELTRDHHPDREDEKARVEAAGGFITRHDVPRINGVLALSRAIGDVYLKRYGVTADPEITGWRAFAPENLHLVLASDGVFEVLTPQNVCDLLHENVSECLTGRVTASSLSSQIIRRALETGSTDNLSAIVISSLDSFTEGTSCNMEKKEYSV